MNVFLALVSDDHSPDGKQSWHVRDTFERVFQVFVPLERQELDVLEPILEILTQRPKKSVFVLLSHATPIDQCAKPDLIFLLEELPIEPLEFNFRRRAIASVRRQGCDEEDYECSEVLLAHGRFSFALAC